MEGQEGREWKGEEGVGEMEGRERKREGLGRGTPLPMKLLATVLRPQCSRYDCKDVMMLTNIFII